MRHGCIVTVAVAVIAGLGLTPAADAACNPRNSTACTTESKPTASTPMQLKRFMALGPARQTGKRTGARRASREPGATAEPAQGGPFVPAPSSTEVSAEPLAPKAIPTVSVSAPAMTLAPASEDRTVGFATTERWTGENAYASVGASVDLLPGVTIARSDEVNEIDLAADTESAKSDRLAGVSLVTPANFMPLPAPAATAPLPERAAAKSEESSWFSWLYGKLVDSVLTAALAIRSIFA